MIPLIIQYQFYTIQNLQRSPIPQTSNWSGTFFCCLLQQTGSSNSGHRMEVASILASILFLFFARQCYFLFVCLWQMSIYFYRDIDFFLLLRSQYIEQTKQITENRKKASQHYFSKKRKASLLL